MSYAEIKRENCYELGSVRGDRRRSAAGPPYASLRAVQRRLPNRTTSAWTVDSAAG